MNRLESIKERLAYFPSELRDGGFSDNSLEFGAKLDIEYLLSKIEIAEKALEIFADDANWYIDERSNLKKPHYTVFDYEKSKNPGEFAKEALKAIRE